MTATVPQLTALLTGHGSDVTYHRETGGDPCPCLTPEGFRDPEWHLDHPTAPVCNEQGRINVVVNNWVVKAAVQPAQSRSFSRQAERVDALLGDVQQDDHIGIFPVTWGGNTLDFSSFDEGGDDYIVYDGRRFVVVAADKVPDIDGDPDHHWELGLRLVKNTRPV